MAQMAHPTEEREMVHKWLNWLMATRHKPDAGGSEGIAKTPIGIFMRYMEQANRSHMRIALGKMENDGHNET